ncbi:MAG: hypothetical protein IJY47_00960 [Clostridia bacterium]|nr:hypothetical protein [Clostridia bacterium]
MKQEAKTMEVWQGRMPLAVVKLRGRGAEGRMLVYATPMGMFVSVRIGGLGLAPGEVYRLGREIARHRELFPWFPPLYERDGEAFGQVMTQKITPGELWGSRFFIWDQRGVALEGEMEPFRVRSGRHALFA